MHKGLKYLCVLLAGALAGWMVSKCTHPHHGEADEGAVKRDTSITIKVDTATIRTPEAMEGLAVETQAHRLPLIRQGSGSGGPALCMRDTTDSKGAHSTECYGTGAGGLPRQCPDSVMVEVPITQLHYKDSLYEAWVSGFSHRLDSLKVYPRTETITIKEYTPPKRWHVGISAGYAITPQGFQPYAGISITYSLYSWR